jgi:hypothetical protein
MICIYCGKECNTNVSLVQHQIRCKNNPTRIECKSGFKGKTHTTEIRKKLSEISKELHQKGICVNPPSWSGKTHTEQTKKQLSKSMVGNTNGVGRGKRTKYKDIWFKSSWEAKVAKHLDDQSIVWKYEETCYMLEGNKSYRPDFFIYENGLFVKLIEVKGYFRKENREKFDMFKQLYSDITIELWDKKVLQELKLL